MNGYAYKNIFRVGGMLFITFFSVLGAAPSSPCQTPMEGQCETASCEVSIQHYVELAAEDNSGLRAAYDRWQAALANVDFSDTLPDPRLSYGLFVKEVETRVGPQKHRLGASQTIPWFGKLKHRRDVAVQAAVVAEEEFCLQYVALVTQLKKAFYEYYYLHQAVQITEANIQLVELVERVAQSQVRVGGSAADVLQAQMEISKLKDHLETVNERLVIAATRINAVLNRQVDTELTLPSNLFEGLSRPEKTAEAQLEEANPMLRILCAQVGKHEQSRRLTRQNRYPDVTVGVDWIQTDLALMATPDSGKDPVIAKISINVPLWQSTYRAQEKAATYRRQSSEDQFAQKWYEVQADFEDVLLKYKEADREIALYENTLIPQAEQTLSILQEAYEAGKADFERYLGAQRVLLDFQLKVEKARVQRASVIADYDFLLGRSGC
jgi:cobalt-zinc-cadmium efflux system outer membrane protein